MEGVASAEKRSVEDFRVRVHGGPHPLRAGSEGAATTFGRDDAGRAPRPPDDANASRRIVAHFDVDAFYSQVEELRDPRLRGRPMAVTQKFLIVTANYAARSAGLKKLMSTTKAKALCPEVALISGEDLTPYRACAKKVRAALERFGTCEKLGLDECWVDLTAEVDRRIAAGGPASDPPLVGHRHSSERVVESDNAHRPMDIRAVDPERTNAGRGVHAPVPPGCDDGADPVDADPVDADTDGADPVGVNPARDRRLRVGAAIAAEARDAVRSATGLRMSAGIAHNKMLAKLVSGLHKPDDQTTLPASHAAGTVSPLPVRALPGVGHGAERELVERGVRTAADLRRVTRSEVCEWLGPRVGRKVHDAAWGVDREEVAPKPPPAFVTCEDSFRSCTTWDAVDAVLRVIAPDLVVRMDEEYEDEVERTVAAGALIPAGRAARTLTVKWRDVKGGKGTGWSRSSASTTMPTLANDRSIDATRRADALREAATRVLRSELTRGFDLRALNVGAGNFEPKAADPRKRPGVQAGSSGIDVGTDRAHGSAFAAMNARRDYDRPGGGRMSKTEERALSERERGLGGGGGVFGGGSGGGGGGESSDVFTEPLREQDEDEEDGDSFYADLADVQRSSAMPSIGRVQSLVPRKRGAEQASLLSFFKGPSKR